MGEEDGLQDARPLHRVHLSSYWFDKYEVTNGQYRQCVEGGGCTPPKDRLTFDDPQRVQYPVTNITWNQARSFCQWQGKRLPTEAEWEKAARGADGRIFPWGDAWDPARDEAAGEACKAYGAASIMRVPGRLHVTWENDATLRIDTDAGEQTRLLHFDAAAPPPGEATWQGHSVAKWRPVVWSAAENSPNGGGLEVVTTGMRSGYLRKNGVPYSENAMLTEYFNRFTAPNGDEWLVVTTIVEDPAYLNRPYVTSSNFKQLPDAAGFNPTPCSAT